MTPASIDDKPQHTGASEALCLGRARVGAQIKLAEWTTEDPLSWDCELTKRPKTSFVKYGGLAGGVFWNREMSDVEEISRRGGPAGD